MQLPSPEGEQALAKLCAAYWQPVHNYIRRRGHSAEDAKDLTQEFFAGFVGKNYLRVVDRARGRFRSFLLTCVNHFLSNEREKAAAKKRGGDFTFVSLDDTQAALGLGDESADSMSPEKAFDRLWALTILQQALDQLKQEYVKAGKAEQFDALEDFLPGAKNASASYPELAARLHLSEVAARQAAYRLRRRLGELLRWNVAQTVANPADVDGELAYLMTALSGQA